MGFFQISDISCPRENTVRLGVKEGLFLEAWRDTMQNWHIAYTGDDLRQAVWQEDFDAGFTRDQIICMLVGMRTVLLQPNA